ncbi:MAG: NAD+ synthase [Chloroflexi bacterium]|jgi:NAD+ synthase|nr:NAD+ synthase [Chloroflexota bacterium]
MMNTNLTINIEQTEKTLTGFIRGELARAGFQRALLGVSGGLDSAVSLYLCAKALGPENVLAARLPYKTSPPHTLADAQTMIDALGARSLTVEITPMVDPLIARFPEMNSLRAGNIMARMRMIVLFDQSVAFNGLVVGASNKTELLLGYTTIHGDSAVALQPLGDLYKTQVRQLARHLGVPDAVINKAPSADLWEGQTDENELGFTYDEVDRLLHLLIERGYSPEACIEHGFERNFVERVVRRVRQNQFKRVMPPIGWLSGDADGYNLSSLGIFGRK